MRGPWRPLAIVGIAGWVVIVVVIGLSAYENRRHGPAPEVPPGSMIISLGRGMIDGNAVSGRASAAMDGMKTCGEVATLLATELKPDSTLLAELGMEIERDEDGLSLTASGAGTAAFRERLDAAIAKRRPQ